MKMFFPLLAMLVLLSACEPSAQDQLKAQMVDSPTEQADIDKNLILQYAIDNNLDVKSTPSGLHYTIEKPGEGEAHPDNGSLVTAHYHGMLLDGKVFDSSVDRGEPLKFQLGGVIPGWQEAIPMLKKGGKGKFLIPSAMAYGARADGKVHATYEVVEEVDVIDD